MISAQQKKDGIAGFISKTIASSEIGNIPEESKTLDTEESGSNGTPKRPLLKRKGKSKCRQKRKTSDDSDEKCSVCNK